MMRDLIEKICNGEDALFGELVKEIVKEKVYVFAQADEEDALTVTFLNYLLEDDAEIEYIPIFSDEQEVDGFVADADVPEGYQLFEFDGDLFADLMDAEQYIMINPISGGIIFQGAHMKAFASPANDE